ncbi:hypothetical protein Q8F55_008514 [Vanrija albida]|uniref:Major facilitator superfamily (MFS) profile domain-containing protein n=1 Tax=Vanrija albida TaxID=181172 RepID=A0ABR3PR23_9TREE
MSAPPRLDTPAASDHDTASAHTPEKAQHLAAEDKAITEGRTAADNASLISDTTLIAQQEGIKPAFLAKVQVLNNALAEIGMGRYQYELFFSGGFGWFADNIWLQGISIIMPSVSYEWRGQPMVALASLSLYVGLILGAAFWGCSCDIVGRRIAWNSTLLIGGVFGAAAGGANNFTTFCAMIALTGFGVGGNLPVDGTMFLEFLPGSHQYLLTLLSIWWAIGQVVASLIAWGFIARWGCDKPEPGQWCRKEDNMGWRYTYITLGCMMIFFWLVRFLVLPVYESPKFLASIGKDEAAVEVIHKIAKRNKVEVHLTVEDLKQAAEPYLTAEEKEAATVQEKPFTTMELLKNSMHEVGWEKVSTLFCNRRLAYSSSLIIFCYAALGLAYPLYMQFLGLYLEARGAEMGATTINSTYASYTYQAACGIPGSIVACLFVQVPRAGRKVAMSVFTVGAGIFLFALTQAKNQMQIDALTSIASFFNNAFYGVIFGYAPELFPTPSRGTGDALCAAAMRITGIFAPVIHMWSDAGKTPNGPVYASAGIFVATGLIMLLLPVETRGKTAL